MTLKPVLFIAAAVAAAVAISAPLAPASAGMVGLAGASPMTFGNMSGGPACKHPVGGGITIYKPVNIYKPINIFKPVNVYKPVNIYKPVTITKNINIFKPVNINKNINIVNNINNNKNINIVKNINDNKNINVNKVIVINKGSGSSEALALAAAAASASSAAGAVSVSGSSSYSDVTNNVEGGGAVAAAAAEACVQQEATIVKSIHAVCVASSGAEFPASHMFGETFIDSSYEGEIARCLPGTTLKVVIGDVVQSDQGMAGTYEGGQMLQCGPGEALSHYKDGMLKCTRARPVPDCTERTNLRRYGTGDMFFSYRGMVCAQSARTASAGAAASASGDVDVTGMSIDGGVGPGGY